MISIYWKQDNEMPECSCIRVEHSGPRGIDCIMGAENVEGMGCYIKVTPKYSPLLFTV